MAHLAIENLTFAYSVSPHRAVLDGVTLEIRQGEYIALCGRSGSGGTKRDALRGTSANLAALTAWALEGAIVTADSMRSRGYGAAKRTNFTPYRFTAVDSALLAVFAAAAAVTLWAGTAGYARAEFVPNLYIAGSDTPLAAAGLAAWTLLLLIPTILHLWEDMTWRILRSKM